MPCPVEITAEDFRDYFDRGQFTYGEEVPAVRDVDIDRASADALTQYNCELYPTEDESLRALLYVTAHLLYLVVAGGPGAAFPASSQSIDGVSVSNSLPEAWTKGHWAQYATTAYGQAYIRMTYPLTRGTVGLLRGRTNP